MGVAARFPYTFSGGVTLADLADAVPVELPVSYPGPYTVVFGLVEVLAGAPAAGAFTPSAESKTPSGFTVALAEAPGMGASVSVPYTVTP